jgi:hypothetical protein
VAAIWTPLSAVAALSPDAVSIETVRLCLVAAVVVLRLGSDAELAEQHCLVAAAAAASASALCCTEAR